jgi:integrase
LTIAQIKDMLDAFKDDDLYMPVMLAVSLGLRRGETLGLQWRNVDLENGLIKIRFNYTMVGDMSRTFSARMKKYGLPGIRFHDPRHSNAALMVGQNVPDKGGSDRLGHSTIQIYTDLYGHLERSVQEQIAETIEETIWGK